MPLALLFLTNRVLNPALVLIEVVLNAYVLFVNRHSVAGVWRRVMPIIIGVGPGVLLGTYIVAQVNPSWVKLITFVGLLPLILLQAAGFRRPIKSERSAGLVFGGGLGVLYSLTLTSVWASFSCSASDDQRFTSISTTLAPAAPVLRLIAMAVKRSGGWLDWAAATLNTMSRRPLARGREWREGFGIAA